MSVRSPNGHAVRVTRESPPADSSALPTITRATSDASLRRTLAIARPAAGRLALSTLLGAGSIGAAIGLIATSAWLISRSSQRPPESAVAVAVVGVQFFALSRGLCRYAERLVGHDAAFRVLADLRVSVYERLEPLAPLGLPAFGGGELLARLIHDVESLQDLVLRVLPTFAIALIVGVATVALVWWMLPAAALILLAALILAGVLVPWLTGRLAVHAEARQADARGELTASVIDLLEGAPELVANGAAEEYLRRTLTSDAELTRIAGATARTAGVGQGLTRLCSGLAMWGALLVGVSAVRSGKLDDVLLAGIALIPLVAFELVTALPGATQTLQRVRHSAARVFEAIETSPPVTEPAHPLTLPVSNRHRLRVEGLHSSYPDTHRTVSSGTGLDSGPRPGTRRTTPAGAGLDSNPRANTRRAALCGVDLDLSSGRRLAVVGPSGAGKSTLAAVLLRFLPYQRGFITLDGLEIAELEGDAYRRVVGLVSQDAHVFDTTIEENLRIAKRDATHQQLCSALEEVRLAEWVRRLPAGMQTEVGERGMRMSGGQRQRLALARAMLADFPVLILDEPGEHLDTSTADAILADLLSTTRAGATLLITHRLVGLERFDEVLVLADGEVLERGTREQLLARGGRYAASCQRDLGNSGRA